MNTKNVVPTTPFVLIMIILGSLFSCESHDPNPLPEDGDYYPLHEGESKYYLRVQLSPDTHETLRTDTLRIVFAGDTTIAEKDFNRFDFYYHWETPDKKIIEQHDLFKIIRKSGHRYYTLPFTSDTTQFVFLETDKPAGTTWTYYSGFENDFKSTFTIEAVNTFKKVNGKIYGDVIVMRWESLYKYMDGPYEHSYTEKKYFAKNVGVIYSEAEFYNYPVLTRFTLMNR